MAKINTTKQDEKLILDRNGMKTFFRMLKYLLKYPKMLVFTFVILGICVAISMANPLIVERCINVHIKNKDMNSLISLSVFALLMNIAMIFLVKLRMYFTSVMSNDAVVRIREDLFKHIQTLDFQFFDSRPAGKIIARLMGDVNSLKNALSNAVVTLIPDLLTVICALVIMLIKSPLLALAAIISLPLLIAGMFFVEAKNRVNWAYHRTKSSNVSAFVHEDIAGVRIVQGFNAEKETEGDFKNYVKDQKWSFVKAILYSDLFGPVIEISSALGTVSLYYIGIKMIGGEGMEVGTLLAFLSYIMMFWQPISRLGSFYNTMITNIAAANRIFDIMDTEPDVRDIEGATLLPEIKGEVEFENVTFSYDGEKNVLENVSFKVKPGQTIALVGPTGAGKTTIVNLLSRFYEIPSGRILVDGNDISKVTLESLRSQLGIMTQDNFLFSGTIKDNIRYGKSDATDEEIEAAAKAVCAHDFIMKMEKGYDTEIKERGAGLSIGQRQLLAFARTMVKKPSILILDEATSSIDTKTEILVQKGIASLLEGRTSFVIAHRLSTIQKADMIFVVDKGGIVEAGTAKELMEKKGEYYKLYTAQLADVSKIA
ncbi:MAG: ABC transporter ATP-binding protein/permease [Lachnospiraceae bacterium]|nr:ABC transporter ATP-binding protein/permease [Lachnospiraceae bacterium]